MPEALSPQRVYRRAWIMLLASIGATFWAYSALGVPSKKDRTITFEAQVAEGVPPLKLQGRVSSIVLLGNSLLIASDESFRVHEERGIKDDDMYGSPQRILKSLVEDHIEISPESSSPSKSARIAISPGSSNQYLHVAVDSPREFSISCPNREDSKFRIQMGVLQRHANGGFFSKSDQVRISGSGIPDTSQKLQLPITITSESSFSVQNLDSGDQPILFELSQPLKPKQSANDVVNGDNLLSEFGGTFSSDGRRPKLISSTFKNVRNLSITNERGEATSWATADNFKLDLDSAQKYDVQLISKDSANFIRISFKGMCTSMVIDGKQALPTALEEIITSNYRFSSFAAGALVSLGIALILIIQRCFAILLDTHLPKPSNDE